MQVCGKFRFDILFPEKVTALKKSFIGMLFFFFFFKSDMNQSRMFVEYNKWYPIIDLKWRPNGVLNKTLIKWLLVIHCYLCRYACCFWPWRVEQAVTSPRMCVFRDSGFHLPNISLRKPNIFRKIMCWARTPKNVLQLILRFILRIVPGLLARPCRTHWAA